MFCAECGHPVARGGESPAQPASVDAPPAEPAKPQNLARTMMGVQASSLFGNRSPGTPPAKTATPHGAFAPTGQGVRQIAPPPSSFGGAAAFGNTANEPLQGPATRGEASAATNESAGNANLMAAPSSAARSVTVSSAANVSAGGDMVADDESSASRPRLAPTRPGLPLAGPPLAPAGDHRAIETTASDDADEELAQEPDETSEPGASATAARPAEPAPAAAPPLAGAPGAGAALGSKTLHGVDFGRDSGNVGAQLAAAVAAAKAAGGASSSVSKTTQPGASANAPAAPPAAVSGGTAANPALPAAAPASGAFAGTPAEAVAAERPRRPLAKTMLGISPDAALGLQRTAAEARPADAAPSAASGGGVPANATAQAPAATPTARGNANPMARTMLGMANPMASLPPPGAPASGQSAAAVPKTTMQGIPLRGQPDASFATGGQGERGGMNRTMLGMAPLGGSGASPDGAGQTPAVLGGRTMLGVPHNEGGGGAPVDPRATTALNTPQIDARHSSVPPPRREIKALWPLVAATLVIVIATLVLLLRSPRTPQVDVSAKIVSTETGEALMFEVPSAPEGSKIRFGGQEKPLAAGRASFALAADSLRVGDNLVLADVVQPDAELASVRITLAVFYRIWVDTAALRAERSALDVVVTALPGTHVTLDGEDLKLDDAGRGVRSYPIDVVGEAKSGVIEHVVRYRVQPPSGDTVVDELRTRIPVAMMQIDRPGREVITDKDSIEIAGAAGKDTRIHLDKTAIPVKDGRFLYRLMLPEPGEYKPRLVASAAGKAPLGVALSIRRVRDLNQAAAQFSPVQDLTYAKLAPNPAIYKGQKISLEGRVYAVDPRGAESVIQMFVRPCPSSRRCPLWVSDPHATDVDVDAWIRVLGVVHGEQQFRSEKNEIVTVPKMEAQFVLPASP